MFFLILPAVGRLGCSCHKWGWLKAQASHKVASLQAFLPLLKKAARESTEKGLSCSKAAIINISTIMGSIEKTSEFFCKPVISYRCSKVWRLGICLCL